MVRGRWRAATSKSSRSRPLSVAYDTHATQACAIMYRDFPRTLGLDGLGPNLENAPLAEIADAEPGSYHGESHDSINQVGAAPGPEGHIDWREHSRIPRQPSRLPAQPCPQVWPSRQLPHWPKACVPGERT